jgi:hypothetical protein
MSSLIQFRPIEADVQWHTTLLEKQKTPSESITWGCFLAEGAGFEPAVGY